MFTYGHFCLLMVIGWSSLYMVRLSFTYYVYYVYYYLLMYIMYIYFCTSFTIYYMVNCDDIIQLNKMDNFPTETEG